MSKTETAELRMTCFRIQAEEKKLLMSHLAYMEIDVQDFFNAVVAHFNNSANECFDGADYNFTRTWEAIVASAICRRNAEDT